MDLFQLYFSHHHACFNAGEWDAAATFVQDVGGCPGSALAAGFAGRL